VRYLLDTNVISEARKASGDARVKAWLAGRAPQELAISVITVLEIDIGIQRLARRDPVSAARLQTWLDETVLTVFADRILSVDLLCARQIAPLHVLDPAPEHDVIIAGTALAHNLIVVTRNTHDFVRNPVKLLNPWDYDQK